MTFVPRFVYTFFLCLVQQQKSTIFQGLVSNPKGQQFSVELWEIIFKVSMQQNQFGKPLMWKLVNEERQMLNGSSLGNNGPSANSKIQFSWGRSLKITWGLKAMNDCCTLIFFGSCHWIYSGTNANKKFSFWLFKTRSPET